MGTHGFSENLYLYPPKTRTHDQVYGFAGVQVRVEAEIPQGYPWHSLEVGDILSLTHKHFKGDLPWMAARGYENTSIDRVGCSFGPVGMAEARVAK